MPSWPTKNVITPDERQLEGKTVEVDEIREAHDAYPVIESALQRYSAARRGGFCELK